MSKEHIMVLVMKIVTEAAERGPGWSQEGLVLRRIGQELGCGDMGSPPDLKIQQEVLNAWHDLFAEKKLGWGYDLDNPGSPFFHIR